MIIIIMIIYHQLQLTQQIYAVIVVYHLNVPDVNIKRLDILFLILNPFFICLTCVTRKYMRQVLTICFDKIWQKYRVINQNIAICMSHYKTIFYCSFSSIHSKCGSSRMMRLKDPQRKDEWLKRARYTGFLCLISPSDMLL